GLQELLTMFHPMVAGVTIPGIALFALILAPYIDKNPSNKPEDRRFAIAIFTLFVMMFAVMVIIGSFFRGPGFNFTLPWRDGLFFDF
ncbi:MAG: menaquinol-cytochrome c reductase cytochrome b subunit, partial [Ilumatobacteraceae bacterium]